MAALTQLGEGRYALSGGLNFATVTALLQRGRELFAGESGVDVDLSGVTHADSAGLSLLIEWLRQARLQNVRLRYQNMPAQLQALAAISEVSDLLTA